MEGLEDDARPYKDPTSLTSDQEKQKFKQNMNYCRIRADVHQIYDKRKPRGLQKLIMKKIISLKPTILMMQPYH